MEDLLKEEEFKLSKHVPVPWQRFYIFYAVVFTIFPIYSVVKKYMYSDYTPSNTHLLIVWWLFPFITSLLLIFHKKSNLRLSFKAIIVSVFGLMITHILSVCFSTLIVRGTEIFFEDELTVLFLSMAALFVIIGIISLIFILPIVSSVQKSLRRKGEAVI